MRFLLCCLFLSGFMAYTLSSEMVNSIHPVPVVDGDWWDIAGVPDLGEFNNAGMEPVDFGIWKAADGTWQLWSCIRNTSIGGHSRLFYRWEGKQLTDTNWMPKGIAMMSDPSIGEPLGGLQAPFVLKERSEEHTSELQS